MTEILWDALIYPASIAVVHGWKKILLLLCIPEAHWKYHIINKHDLGDTLLEILERWGT
jgi:hypothetical protein